jgi:arylsulfatase A-like enzyme
MAELLAPTHDTAGFSENPHIVEAKGFAQGFGHYEETWRLRKQRGEVPPTVEHAVAWLREPGGRDGGRPFFLFVNLMDPHLPYVPPDRWASGLLPPSVDDATVQRMRAVSEREARLFMTGKLRFSGAELDVLRALYGAEVAFADDRLGRILAAIEEDGSLDETLVVVLSDHGENIGEHGLMEHQLCLYETLLRVPLAMRLPGVFDGGAEREGPVQVVDLLPTVLDVVDVPESDWPAVEGMSLVHDDPDPGRAIYAEYMRPLRQRARFEAVNPEFDFDRFDRRLKSVQIKNLKLIAPEGGELELYDLSEDPGETRNLSGRMPGVARTLLAHLDRWATAPEHAHQPEPALDPETIEALRELGYVE